MSDAKEPNKANRDEKGRLLPGHAGLPGAGRRRMREDVRAMLEEATPKAAKALIDALEANKALVVGNGPHASVQEVPDHTERRQAAEAIYSRLYGRPSQEVTGGDGGALFGALVPDLLDSMRNLAGDK